jgi:hypothetical protein
MESKQQLEQSMSMPMPIEDEQIREALNVHWPTQAKSRLEWATYRLSTVR